MPTVPLYPRGNADLILDMPSYMHSPLSQFIENSCFWDDAIIQTSGCQDCCSWFMLPRREHSETGWESGFMQRLN